MLTTDKIIARKSKNSGKDPNAPASVVETYAIEVYVTGDTSNSVVRAEVKFDNLETLPTPSVNPIHCYAAQSGIFLNDNITFSANSVGCEYVVNVLLYNDLGIQLMPLQSFTVTVQPEDIAS